MTTLNIYLQNGSEIYPGVKSVIQNGITKSVSNVNKKDIILRNGDIVNRHLIDTPPTLVNTNAPIENSEFIQLEFNLPTQIFVGFLNKKLPIIDDLFIDFKKSDETDYTTINIGSILINKIIIYPFDYTNYIDNQTFYLFNILKETEYDFRVYAKNNNTIRPTNYLEFNNLKTKTPNLLPPPNNISINKNLNNSSTSMDLNWTHSISPNIPIYQYNISYSTLDSIKYPSFIHHNSNKIISILYYI